MCFVFFLFCKLQGNSVHSIWLFHWWNLSYSFVLLYAIHQLTTYSYTLITCSQFKQHVSAYISLYCTFSIAYYVVVVVSKYNANLSMKYYIIPNTPLHDNFINDLTTICSCRYLMHLNVLDDLLKRGQW